MIALTSSSVSESKNGFTTYYDQLNMNGKAIYDAMEGADAETTSIAVDLPLKVTVRSESVRDADIMLDALMKETINTAMSALQLSSPMAYWGWHSSIISWKLSKTIVEDIAIASSVTFYISLSKYTRGLEEGEFQGIQKMLDDLNEAVERFSTSGTTIRDKVMDINNYIVNLVTYDPHIKSADEGVYSHDAYGALMSPNHYAVCDGYSEAFLLLCQKEGIECVVVLGTGIPDYVNHAWNYVKLDDGKWYAIDVTWNDGTKNAYFLMGGESFFTTHHQGVFLEASHLSYKFDSPAISKTSYEKQQKWYEQYMWVFAVVIAGIVLAALYRRFRP